MLQQSCGSGAGIGSSSATWMVSCQEIVAQYVSSITLVSSRGGASRAQLLDTKRTKSTVISERALLAFAQLVGRLPPLLNL